MQFIKDGPDIPERLIQEHEEGRVVFFCGAGIAYPAGLPGFKELVDKIYTALSTRRDPIEDAAYSRYQYDATLSLLEGRILGNRTAVRRALVKSLQPNLRRKGATDTHKALLELAKDRGGSVRIVTTNFDGIFQRLTAKAKQKIAAYPAPQLPIPKNSRWNGIVYLHGLLPANPDDSDLNRLVLSSGDFGLAYLTERWAARFVSELFRNYVVCFVGYSINDPVLRYMMDALAADRMLGEATPQAYAFGDFKSADKNQKQKEWKSKGVVPILYEIPNGSDSHDALHKTLQLWAETYRDGISGRERVVVANATTRPIASTQQDNFVGRMLWALSHDSGLAAKRFAEHDPVPSLEWLEPFCDRRYGYSDLPRFGVPTKQLHDDAMAFSLAHRPAPYTHAPAMILVNSSDSMSRWDNVMFQLARWLIRHLDDPTLVWWIVKRGGQLDEQFKRLVESRLDEISRLERNGDSAALASIRLNAPMAIPRLVMRIAWRLLLTDSVKQISRHYDIYRWKDRFKRDGFTPTLRLELRELLTPRVLLQKPYGWGATEISKEPRFKDLVHWEIVLSADHVRSSFADLVGSEDWKNISPLILTDIQHLLQYALDLMRDLGEATDQIDRSHWELPSISHHWQNRGFHDWTFLIELLRDAWLAINEKDPKRAARIAEDWASQSYLTFMRLALFASTHNELIGEDTLISWLFASDRWWLWSVETQREVMRLLVLRGSAFSPEFKNRLEMAILDGPPRRMFKDGLSTERWERLVDSTIWLRFAKLESSGASLGGDAKKRLDDLKEKNPDWKFESGEKEEFSFWMGGTGDPDYVDRKQYERVPRNRRDIVNWLMKPPSDEFWHENDWSEVCRDRFSLAASALMGLAKENKWPTVRWREALQVWSSDKSALRSWRYMAPVIGKMPQEDLRQIASTVSWWMETVSKAFDHQEPAFFELSWRFMSMDDEAEETSDNQPIMRAINAPIGHIARALLNRWFRRKPEDRQGLPDDIRLFFDEFCEGTAGSFKHARVLLATNAIALYRVDPDWTSKYLLRYFSWNDSAAEAPAVWQGFLWSPRLYRPLLSVLRIDFLACAQHYNELGEHAGQYAGLLAFVALDPADTFTTDELQQATGALPVVGLQKCIDTLVQGLDGAGDQRSEYWQNRVMRYLNAVWPQSTDSLTPAISSRFARLCVAAGDAFPEALAALEYRLQNLAGEHNAFVMRRLNEGGLAERFPDDALKFLSILIPDNALWLSEDCDKCLDAIVRVRPDLADHQSYKRIRIVLRKLGRG